MNKPAPEPPPVANERLKAKTNPTSWRDVIKVHPAAEASLNDYRSPAMRDPRLARISKFLT